MQAKVQYIDYIYINLLLYWCKFVKKKTFLQNESIKNSRET